MELYILILLISSATCISISYRYEVEYLNADTYSPCEDYPNNSMNSLFDTSNLKMEQTEEGSIGINGYVIIKKSVDNLTPLSIEVFKKERGTWQPTVYTLNRPDTCTAFFSKTELWHSYYKNTPREQLTCPFREGKRFDLNINQSTYIDVQSRNIEGVYKAHMEIGFPNGDFYACGEVSVAFYKI